MTQSPPPPLPLTARETLAAVCGFAAALLYGFHSTLPDLPGPFQIVDIGSDRFRYQWVSGASNLGSIAGMSVLPWLRSRFGLRRCYFAGLLLYSVGGLAGVWLRDDMVLAATTLVAAVGNGLVVTTVLSLLWLEFPGRRDWSIGLYVVGLYLGRILAPSVSGVLINEPSWRTVAAVPAALAGLVLVGAYESHRANQPPSATRDPFDFPGLFLLLSWVTCLFVGLSRFQLWGWDTADATAVVYTAGVLMFTGFVARQLTATHPLFDLSLLRNRRFALSVVIKATADVTFVTVLLAVTRYMVIDRGYPRTTTGLVLLPSVVAMLLALLFTARFGTRGNRKVRLVLGMAGLAVCTWLLTRIDLFTDKRWLAVVLAVWSGCAGCAGSPVVCITFDGLTQAQVAASASIKNVMRVLPTLIGVGVLAVFTDLRATALFDLERQTIESNRPPAADVSLWIQDRISPYSTRPADLPAQADSVLSGWVRANATVWATQSILGYFALIAAAGAGMSLFLRPLPPDAPGPLRG
ncbi:MFS transporter [Fimbriiglobus ruber]|uniref:Integral membrane protein n=1 Tax=Fimbriiglobus ruber TaxID=1908690 RepID=A0A225DJW4_9BACT|nr:MFS transporter [Fimbriiglobus ruber]OWK36685.1 Integral membrane protein [Fimbriiglobus ruber]